MIACNFDPEPSLPSVKVGSPPSMVERMTLILDMFEGSISRLTLEELTVATQLPRSTVHRILDQLIQLDWIRRGASGYRLGKRAMIFGDRYNAQAQIRAAASPLLHELQVQTGKVVHLSVLDGGDIIYLDKIGGRLAAAMQSQVGGRAPAHSTAGGKAMLAWLPPERIDSLYNNGLKRRTDRTISDLTVLHLELNRIRRRYGLAFDQGEAMPGIACVGAAIRISDDPVAGISLSVGEGEGNLERFAPLVMAASGEASRALASNAKQIH